MPRLTPDPQSDIRDIRRFYSRLPRGDPHQSVPVDDLLRLLVWQS